MSRGTAALANAVRMQAGAHANGRQQAQWATISSYDGNLSVKVMLQPQNLESEWMPLGCIGVGDGWGVAVGPNIGDQVYVEFPEGDVNSGVITARAHNVEHPPMPVPAGEIWAVQKSGSFLKFLANGDVALNVVGNYTETVTGTATRTAAAHHLVGPVQMDNTLNVTETISGEGGMSISGDNGTGHTSTVNGNLNTTGTITNNGHDIGSTHQHVDSGGSGLGGPPQ
ncbi:phage baseplate assembly protein V [Paraburkholderia xenovorans]|uniref:phage baseplate assembly protein V n=1 Tax=Paraburkholderia xenovorans TaxID=36873 RepID=UPI0038B9908C